MRSRVIKPEFWSDEKLARVSREARLFFAGLWSVADDHGVTHANPSLLKSHIFPYDDDLKISTVKQWIDKLVDMGMLIPYTADNGETYLFIRTFPDYQKIDHPSKTGYNPTPREGLAKLSRITREAPRKLVPQTETETETETETKPLAQSNAFERFWSIYPRKVGKKKAKQAFAKINPQNGMLETMLEAIKVQATSDQWTKDGGQYIPHASTWLNGARWQDEGVSLESVAEAKRRQAEEEYARRHKT
jgi:hypothetical protein